MHVLLFVRALRVGCCAWPRAVTAPWSTITPRSNTVVMELKRAFPAVTCLWLQFCQAQELRTVLFGIIYIFLLLFFSCFLLTFCNQQREGRSCHVLQVDRKSQTSRALKRVQKYQERKKGGGRGDISLNGRKEVGNGSQKVIMARGK